MSSTVQLGTAPLTGTDSYGCEWRTISPIVGWDGSPASTLALTQKPRQAGAWRGPRPQLAPRHVTLNGFVQAPSTDELEAAIDRLNAAASIDTLTALTITRGSKPRTANVYRDGVVDVQDVTDLIASWALAVTAPDPLRYGPTQVVSTGLPHQSGGLTWPVKWPIEWDGVNDSGVITINNPGDIAAPLTLRVDGPCTGPTIRHSASGVELTLATDYTLAAGAFLVIDMENRTVLEGGTASRNGFITQRGWFTLDKGANDLIFSAQTYNTTAKLTATYAPAYQ